MIQLFAYYICNVTFFTECTDTTLWSKAECKANLISGRSDKPYVKPKQIEKQQKEKWTKSKHSETLGCQKQNICNMRKVKKVMDLCQNNFWCVSFPFCNILSWRPNSGIHPILFLLLCFCCVLLCYEILKSSWPNSLPKSWQNDQTSDLGWEGLLGHVKKFSAPTHIFFMFAFYFQLFHIIIIIKQWSVHLFFCFAFVITFVITLLQSIHSPAYFKFIFFRNRWEWIEYIHFSFH